MAEPTNRELMDKLDVMTDMIHSFATHMDDRFDEQHKEIVTELRGEIQQAKHEVMDYVDRKVDASEARVIEKINRTDEKVERLINVLGEKKVLTVEGAHHVVTGV